MLLFGFHLLFSLFFICLMMTSRLPCPQVFEELLLDADWSVNAGSWMWLSCSSFFQQFFHCYCPVGFGRRTDPNGDYIRYRGSCDRGVCVSVCVCGLLTALLLLFQALPAHPEGFPSQVHLRPLERSRERAEGGQVPDRAALPQTHGEPRRGQPPQHRAHEADLPAAVLLQGPG